MVEPARTATIRAVGPYSVRTEPSQHGGQSSSGTVVGGEFEGEYIGSCGQYSSMTRIHAFSMSGAEARAIRDQFSLDRGSLHLDFARSEAGHAGQYCITSDATLIAKIKEGLDCEKIPADRCEEIKSEFARLIDPTGATDNLMARYPVSSAIALSALGAVVFVGLLNGLPAMLRSITTRLEFRQQIAEATALLEAYRKTIVNPEYRQFVSRQFQQLVPSVRAFMRQFKDVELERRIAALVQDAIENPTTTSGSQAATSIVQKIADLGRRIVSHTRQGGSMLWHGVANVTASGVGVMTMGIGVMIGKYGAIKGAAIIGGGITVAAAAGLGIGYLADQAVGKFGDGRTLSDRLGDRSEPAIGRPGFRFIKDTP